jgi:Arc/MetJ family transcription regulator
MTRITVEVNDELLEAAREVLGTDTSVATINAALRSVTKDGNRGTRQGRISSHVTGRDYDLGRC